MALSTIDTDSLTSLAVTPAKMSQKLTSGTAVASTSGTSIDFTSIPSWVKRITVIFNGVSTNGTSFPQIQIGAGSVTTTGYLGTATNNNPSSNSQTQITSGQPLAGGYNASVALRGSVTISTLGSNTWVFSGTGMLDTNTTVYGGYLTLGGTLDRIRVTTVNGTDTFDAGSINILME
jgi:hypothetical protein